MRFSFTKLVHAVLLVSSLFLSACGGNAVTATVAAPATADSASTGTDFYVALPDHLCVSGPVSCNHSPVTNKLIVGSPASTSGEVTFNGVVTPFSISAGGQAVITLDPGVVLTANETVEAKGIHVTALSPVSVHVVSENVGSADGYLALPASALGTRYYVMSYVSNVFTGSELAVAATRDNTTVTITPAAAGASNPAGTAFTVLLNSGETYLFANPAHADMTGTLVTADQPVAVFSGHRCANVPSSSGYCDYLVEQLPDVTRWGKTHHTSPFSGRARYTVRVIASQDGTTFATTPSAMVGTLNAGQFADVVLSGPGEFVSNNPVLVAQFVHGHADDAAGKGDPSMVIVTPAEHAVTEATFGVHGLSGTPGAYLNIVAETASLANLKLDSLAMDTSSFTPIGGASGYSTGTIQVAPGVHTLRGTGAYSALVYDYGVSWNSVSYAYPVAARFSAPASDPVIPAPAVSAPDPTGCWSEDDDHDDEQVDHDARKQKRDSSGDHSGHGDHDATHHEDDDDGEDDDHDCDD